MDRDDASNDTVASASDASSLETEVKLLREFGLLKYGCKHYRRRCMMVAPCCGEIFWCRHCHNEAKMDGALPLEHQHELDRNKVKEVVCGVCEASQPIGEYCTSCGVAFGVYTCLRCSFFDDDISKQQFHCDACGICRVGGRENYFHCQKCGCCYHISLQDNHVCVENSMRQNCPVCFEYLFDSVRQTSILTCGHTIHTECLLELERNNEPDRRMACPICMKSYADLTLLWRHMDEAVASTPMPEEYANWRSEIFCNDCNASAKIQFHIIGLKCPDCGSYNTRKVSVDRGEST